MQLGALAIGLGDACWWGIAVFQADRVHVPLLTLFGMRLVWVALYSGLVWHMAPRTLTRSLFALFAGLFLAAFSVFGVMAMLAVLKLVRQEGRPHSLLYHIDQEAGAEDSADDAPPLHEINLHELRKVAPLADAMTDDQKNIRVAAILAMEQVEVPSIRRALLAARNDPSKEVQYYAHEALKKIGEAYTNRIKHLTARMNASDEPGFEEYHHLADAYAEFAQAGIEHPVLVAFYWQEAVRYYGYLLETYPDRQQIILQRLIPALYATRAYDRCAAYCEQSLTDAALRDLCIEYQARCLFAMRKVAALTTFAAQTHDADVDVLTNFHALCEESRHG